MHRATTSGGSTRLSLDFDVRSLVPQESWSPARQQRFPLPLDAIYIPSRSRPANLCELLRRLGDPGVPIYVLPTSEADFPKSLPEKSPATRLLPSNEAWVEPIRGLASFSQPPFSIHANEWDLPLKRNYAILHALHARHCRILLLDDDICLSVQQLAAGAASLDRYDLAGFFVDDFPDTSLIGHVERAVGEPLSPFLSGSCLFIRTDVLPGPFPAIYNEDWICMAPAIARGRVVSLGLVRQKPYAPFADPSLATFQEPGEIIADGLFALIAAGAYHRRRDPTAWHDLLNLRRSWLRELSTMGAAPAHTAILRLALQAGSDISADACVRFIDAWEDDRILWSHIAENLTL